MERARNNAPNFMQGHTIAVAIDARQNIVIELGGDGQNNIQIVLPVEAAFNLGSQIAELLAEIAESYNNVPDLSADEAWKGNVSLN